MYSYWSVCRLSLVLAAFFIGVAGAAGAAHAQNIFSSIFGFVVGPQKPPVVIVPRRVEPGFGADGPMYSRRPSFGGRYRTVCVRLCDGYYFPVSQATSRRHFYRDAEVCQSLCRGQTRLFYTPSDAPDMKRAVDISGLSYRNLANAFTYRKKLVKGCVCRPAPW